MKSRPGSGSIAFDRRQFLSAGMGALALGGVGFTTAPLLAQDIQIGVPPDATPPAPPVPELAAPAGETIEELAARLRYDQDAIVAFVRNEIRYEAYAGVLRGAKGTLWARAGNAADQAVLLSELLTAAQVTHRFAIGPLDADTESALMDALRRNAADAPAAWDAAEASALLRHSGLQELPATPPPFDPAMEALIGEFEVHARRAVDLALASTEMSTTMISGALAEAGISLPSLPVVTLPDRERQRHAWIQIADGPDWIDADPSLPEAAAALSQAEMLETLPDEWYHWLRFEIAADEWHAGSMTRREVVSLSAASARVVDVPVALSMASADEIVELGSTVNQVLSGQKTIYPSIFADGVTVNASQPILFATDVASALDPFGDTGTEGIGEEETVSVWLRVEIASPDAAPVVVERALLDRLPPEDRANGTLDPARIAPVQTVPTEIGDDTLEQFSVLTVIHTDVARIPPTNAFVRFGRDGVFGALGVLGPALAGFRDMLGIAVETEAGFWSYPSAPNLTAFHASGADPATGEGQARIQADLLHRQRTSLPLAGAAPTSSVHPLVLSGVLDAVAEQMLLAPETRGQTADASAFATGPSVFGIFAQVADGGPEVRVVTSSADLDGIEADPQSRGYLSAALAAGQIVLVPVAPVDLGGEPVLGWWIVDPATGRTRDQLQNGMAGATTGFPGRASMNLAAAEEYSFLVRAIMWVAANARWFACLGLAAGAAFVFTGAMLRLADAAAAGAGLGQLAAYGGFGGGAVAGATIGCIG